MESSPTNPRLLLPDRQGPRGEAGFPSVEESFRSRFEPAPGLDDFVEVGRVGVHPFPGAGSGASDGFLLGELADGAAADEGLQRVVDGAHDLDVEAEGIEGGECAFGRIEGVRPK